MINVWNFDFYDSVEEEWTDCQYYLRSDRREDAVREFQQDYPTYEFTCTLEDTVTVEEIAEALEKGNITKEEKEVLASWRGRATLSEKQSKWKKDIEAFAGSPANFPIIDDTELKVAKLYEDAMGAKSAALQTRSKVNRVQGHAVMDFLGAGEMDVDLSEAVALMDKGASRKDVLAALSRAVADAGAA